MVAVALVLIAGLSVTSAPRAWAAPSMSMGINQTTSGSQGSGNEFDYTLAFQCSSVGNADPENPDVCSDVVITIPLGVAKDFDPQVLDNEWVDSWSVDTEGNLVIVLKDDISAGTSITIPFSLRPPNNTTPDGTSWTLTPSVSGSAGTEATPPPGYAPDATSESTAAMHNTITKSLVGNAYREPGDTVTWNLRVACTQTAAGNLLAQSLHVTDALPDGLTYVSSNPAATVDGQNLSWDLTGAELPESCTTPGSSGYAVISVTTTVDNDVELGPDGAAKITNTASTTGTAIDGTDGDEKSASADVTVVTDPTAHPGDFSKDSFAELRDEDATGAGEEANSHTTYPGNWAGFYVEQPTTNGSVLRNYTPNTATGLDQAGYKMRYTNITQGIGYQVTLVDPMPCFGDPGEPVKESHAVGAPRCAQADLAFHPTTVALWVHNNADNDFGPGITPGYVPTAVVASSGATISLVETARSSDCSQGCWANYKVPAIYLGNISEITFPRDAGIASDDIRWAVFGVADSANVRGNLVRNTAQATSYFQDSTTAARTVTESADIFIADSPQIGIDKSFATSTAAPGQTVSMDLTGRLRLPGRPGSSLVFADLLPAGMSWSNPWTSQTVSVQVTTITGLDPSGEVVHVDMPVTATVINNYQGTGRQLLRFTVPQTALGEYSAAQFEVPIHGLQITMPQTPGKYTNLADLYYDNRDLSTQCQQLTSSTQQADDPQDLDGNGQTTDRHCEAPAAVTINPVQSAASFSVVKTVQGDHDAAPKTSPAIGLVEDESGTVTFGLTWTNTSNALLSDAVIYDVFPHPGDVGVSGSQSDQPRSSEFRAVFVSLMDTLPAGVTAYYSTSDNPCRPEVYPSQPAGCTDDWTTSVPADASSVAALKFVSGEQYHLGEGFAVTFTMTTPALTAGEVAWNSAAGTAKDVGAGSYLPPTEPPKVGITAYAESLPPLISKTVDKQVAGPGDTLHYTITVFNPGEQPLTDVAVSDTLPDTVTLVDPGTGTASGQTVSWLIAEIGPYQQVELAVEARINDNVVGTVENAVTSPGAIIPDPCLTDSDSACATTDVTGSRFTVSKSVTGEGVAFAKGPYEMTVHCSMEDGQAIAGYPRTVSLLAGQVSEALLVPTGAVCRVTEEDRQGATRVVINPSGDFTVNDDEVQVVVENQYDVGSLVVEKTVAGVGAQFAPDAFTIDVACTLAGRAVWSGTVTVNRAPGETQGTSDPIGPLPIGASCVASERSAFGADMLDSVKTVQISGASTPVELTNVYSAGTVSVTKQVTGRNAGALAPDAQFQFTVTCSLPDQRQVSYPVSVNAGQTVAVTASGEESPQLFPVGTACWAQETDSQGATRSAIDHRSRDTAVVVQAGNSEVAQPLVITAVNTFDPTAESLASTGGAPPLSLEAGVLMTLLGAALVSFVVRRRQHI